MKKVKVLRLFLWVQFLVLLVGALFYFTPPWGHFEARYIMEGHLLVEGWFKQSWGRFPHYCCFDPSPVESMVITGRTSEGSVELLAAIEGDFPLLVAKYDRVFVIPGVDIDEVVVSLGYGGRRCCPCMPEAAEWRIPVP